ncbi:probable LRR receptor-like serine/threonine-protein kinase At3g47570 isoform X2 [Citrus sinensis]|uniref:probable LRR receptor-like serine/threonine-protein kinase At3g47570 isoform X2 n=1 Tax=Citrus sinensis TaxID=2711 RepID=UPI002278758C|nr:probable LRR receptor-like serine/threonine-protein kinase At3g47570 isoform X2 [Citrus sinensis]
MERMPSARMMNRFLLLHCLILSFMIVSANTTSITTDQQALLSLKGHVTDDPANFLARNWNTSSSVCNWTGVTCDVCTHRVTALNISRLNLTGTIPSELGNLSSLQTLDLSFNWFSGSIPASIFNMSSLLSIRFTNNTLFGELPPNFCNHLSNLESLFLKSNMFHGKIPSTLSNCKRLRNISLSLNDFSGTIPKEIGNVTKLIGLYLQGNQLQGEIPEELGNLGELVHLWLDNNFLTGTIPSSIFNLSSLSILDLSHNGLTGEIPHEIGNLHNLEWMAFSFNKLVGVVPTTIFNVSTLNSLYLQSNSLSGRLPSSADVRLPNLEELLLWGNNFSGTIPSFIFNASKLSRLELEMNSFYGFIPNTFGNLRNLKRLSLNYNYLTSSTPKLNFLSSLSNCKYLKYLSFSNNSLDGILPRAIGNLSQSMEVFFMFNCNISGSIPEEISNLTNLTTIYLGGNKLNGSIPIALDKLQKLQLLSLEDNQLEGSIPDDLCRLAALFLLDLGGNKLSGFVPACFGNLTSLRNLYLGSNQLTSIPSTLWNLKYILYLNLSSNSFTGPLPLEIGNLRVLVQIDLSMNNFSGFIPTTIGDLKDLQYLFLEYNRLQGSIPDSIGGLIDLKSLDLSNNNISGAIPISLEKLLDLKYINVSFNKLEGEIPREGPFRNFSAESFKGNELLCGTPNLQVPPCRTRIHHTSRKNDLLLGIVLPLSTIFMMAVILLILRYRKRGKSQLADANMPLVANLRRFTHLELFQATNGFSENNLIGRGGVASVYKARIQDGIEVAVKVFDLQYEGAFKSFDIECDMMKRIRHRNLIKIISSCSNDDFKALVLEYMPHGSLEKCLYSSNYILDIFQRLNIMIDVASALEYLHFGYSVPIIHCDLKPNNVLLDDNMVAHLSDFGMAKPLLKEDQSLTQTQTLATIGYMAPEYGREGRVSTNGDVYSFGIMLIETFTWKKPTDEIFSGEMTLKCWVDNLLPISVIEVVDANLLSQDDKHFVTKEQCLSFVFNLAMKCTVESPEQRINAKEIVTRLLKIRDSLLKNVKG